LNVLSPHLDQSRYRAVLERLGQPGSRELLATPALECDLDRLDANIAVMSSRANSGGVQLRPHVKCHKSAFVARRQLRAGAAGLSFAKLSEAEAVMAHLARGAERISVLLTSPLVGVEPAARARDLAQTCDLAVVVDTLEGVDELARAFETADASLSVLCDVDVGLGRTGVVGVDEARRVVERISSKGLRFGGVQGYAGHVQHVKGRDERRAMTVATSARLAHVIDALEADGVTVELRTGGGTGTFGLDIELGVLNELQCGSYVFMDRQYRDALGDDDEGRFDQSLFLATTIISANHEGHVTTDAGFKAMATDAGPPAVWGHEATKTYGFFGDEQGLLAGSGSTWARGDRLHLVPPHCDPTVNLYDVIWLVRENVVLDYFLVDARGCSQ
jgi:D-serine deaminase-like pyridoxal phosphate-dependent protein